jgi:hypothetical protein
MLRLQIWALVLGLAVAADAASAAGAYRGAEYCGAGYDRCMDTCNVSLWTPAPPPLPPGLCNDYCARGTNICDALRIPRPGHRLHHY